MSQAHDQPTTLRVVVVGPTGRMGQQVLAACHAAADVAVVACIGRAGEAGAVAIGELGDFDVLIDFSHPSAVATHAALCRQRGAAWVLGTTGLDAAAEAEIAAAAAATVVFVASNFSVGVALLHELAARAAQVLGLDADIEIVESHHHHKVDAPSGTAMTLATAVAGARGQDGGDALRHGRAGQVGARSRGEIGMHAMRLGDVVGHHEVHFGWAGEGLVLSHDARDRAIFARGALRAARFAVAQRRAGLVGRIGMRELLRGA